MKFIEILLLQTTPGRNVARLQRDLRKTARNIKRIDTECSKIQERFRK